jgi:hypothetical protein
MYHKRLIKEPLTLSNTPMLVGSMSEPEQIIIGGIQSLSNLEYFWIEFPIFDEKDSPRIDFVIKVNNRWIAIEVNGYQHFTLGFNKDKTEYRNQWLRYIQKINWCRDRKIPIIHINILFDSRNSTKEFRKKLYEFVSTDSFQNTINFVLNNNVDASINITNNNVLLYNPSRHDSGISDYKTNRIIENIVLGQDKKSVIQKTIMI